MTNESPALHPPLPAWTRFYGIVPSLILIIGLIPTVIYLYILHYFHYFSFATVWHFVLFPFLFFFGGLFLLVTEMLVTGGIIKLLDVTYKPGTYEYSLRDKNARKWILIVILYTPFRKLLEIIPLGSTKRTYFRLLGMKIGYNSLVGGVIKDPCLTEFGDNVTMGEYAIIYGHIHNMQHETIMMDRVRVGNNCVIGAGAIIMPGAVLEDDVVVASGAVVTKGQLLTKGGTYVGVPAKLLAKKT
ncbi:MAG TPA: DapH/DapD/GlmU-related protein [Candidatus Thermoplasmatota archaeon]|nr:DapH/DapD/GlmU-related protein [Candidatus Thermoplasmatota archaeon]